MPRDTQMTNLAVNTEADALALLADGGYMRHYTGPKPPNGDTAITTQVMLAELRLASPAFGPAVAGVLTANPITGAPAVAEGDSAFVRIFRSDGVTPLWDESVGTIAANDANVLVPTVHFIPGVMVTCSDFKHTVFKSIAGL